MYEVAQAVRFGYGSFSDLVEAMPGPSPFEVVEALKKLSSSIGEPAAFYLKDASTAPASAKAVPQGEHLPLPHPLDAEWRFTNDCARELWNSLLRNSADEDEILLLGTPMTSLAALESKARRTLFIQGDNNVVCSALELRTLTDDRVKTGRPRGTAAAAVMDPPWYLPAYTALFPQVSECVRPNGLLFVGAPQPGTRPDGAADRRRILAIAESAGFCLQEVRSRALNYRTPLFELAALEAAGILAWLPSWRRGDQLVFQKVRAGKPHPSVPREPHLELTVDGLRLRLLPRRRGETPALRPVSEREVFPSISSRADGRAMANLWTTSNRAFAVDPIAAAAGMLQLADARGLVLPEGLVPGQTTDSLMEPIDATDALIQELDDLIVRETIHSVKLAGESSWLQTINEVRFSNGSWRAFLDLVDGTES